MKETYRVIAKNSVPVTKWTKREIKQIHFEYIIINKKLINSYPKNRIGKEINNGRLY